MIRFSTVAANADVIGEDTPMAEPERSPRDGDRSPGEQDRSAAERAGARRESDGAAESGAAPPGQDINAPGFIKDKDAGRPV